MVPKPMPPTQGLAKPVFRPIQSVSFAIAEILSLLPLGELRQFVIQVRSQWGGNNANWPFFFLVGRLKQLEMGFEALIRLFSDWTELG